MHNFPFYLLQRQFKFTISIVKLIATQFLYQAESTIHASFIEAFHSSLQVTLDGKIQAYIFEKSLTSLERFHVYCYIIAHVQVIHSGRIVQCQHELHKIDFFVQNDKATFTFLDLVFLIFLRWMQCGQDLHYFAILHSV